MLLLRFLCDSYRIQTCNLLIRSQVLYSVELRSRVAGQAGGLLLFVLYDSLGFLDAGLLAGEVAEVEDACSADFSYLVELDGIDEG